MMKMTLVVPVVPETKIMVDAIATLLQKSPSGVVDRLVRSFLDTLPEEQRTAIEVLKAAAVRNMDVSLVTKEGASATATYNFSRLCFRRDVIEAIGSSEEFRVITPTGTFQMTKADFYRDFRNVVESKSYREDGIYHYPKVPARAQRYRVS
jgi:hypothetical protein